MFKSLVSKSAFSDAFTLNFLFGIFVNSLANGSISAILKSRGKSLPLIETFVVISGVPDSKSVTVA